MKYKHSRTRCQLKYCFAKTISSSSLGRDIYPLSVYKFYLPLGVIILFLILLSLDFWTSIDYF